MWSGFDWTSAPTWNNVGLLYQLFKIKQARVEWKEILWKSEKVISMKLMLPDDKLVRSDDESPINQEQVKIDEIITLKNEKKTERKLQIWQEVWRNFD